MNQVVLVCDEIKNSNELVIENIGKDGDELLVVGEFLPTFLTWTKDGSLWPYEFEFVGNQLANFEALGSEWNINWFVFRVICPQEDHAKEN